MAVPDELSWGWCAADSHTEADEEGTKYPYKWLKLCHPGGPGCKTNKDFRQPGYDFVKNFQAEIQVTSPS